MPSILLFRRSRYALYASFSFAFPPTTPLADQNAHEHSIRQLPARAESHGRNGQGKGFGPSREGVEQTERATRSALSRGSVCVWQSLWLIWLPSYPPKSGRQLAAERQLLKQAVGHRRWLSSFQAKTPARRASLCAPASLARPVAPTP